MEGKLVLADGTVYLGRSFGASGEKTGEVVFTTNMCGYQEVLTDPSYRGQITVMTYPLIGNYGMNELFNQSNKPQLAGFVAKEFCELPSHWQSQGSIREYFRQHNLIALDGIDTRSLTKRLRLHGTMPGIISTDAAISDEELIQKAREIILPADLVNQVSARQPYQYNQAGTLKIAVVDLGVKTNILKRLASLDCQLTVFPYDVKAEELLSGGYDGVLFSNGPGNPKDVPQTADTAKQVLGRLPVMGICLGHQIICLALGADTYKLKFGHRGGNQPVKDLSSGKIVITTQNHGYAVSEDSLTNTDLYISHRNLNDNTVEGVASKSLPLISVQYHPEAAPGPNDGEEMFTKFLTLVLNRKNY